MLRDVPEDEAEDIRALLSENSIDYYEVPASFMGITPASFWLRDSAEYQRAKALVDDYQTGRTARARSEYEKLRDEGKNMTLFGSAKAHPFRFLVYIALIAIVIYFSLSPFLNFGK